MMVVIKVPQRMYTCTEVNQILPPISPNSPEQTKQANSPLSFVNAICFCISARLTVALFCSIDLSKSFFCRIGSCNSVESTSVQDFSWASGSPGEQGVRRWAGPSGVCIVIYVISLMWRLWEGRLTGLKWVAARTFRTGCIRASRTTTAISLPEYLNISYSDWLTYPSVSSAKEVKSACVRACGVVPILSSNIFRLACTSGNGIYIRFSNLALA
jgi:hypothetical protein